MSGVYRIDTQEHGSESFVRWQYLLLMEYVVRGEWASFVGRMSQITSHFQNRDLQWGMEDVFMSFTLKPIYASAATSQMLRKEQWSSKESSSKGINSSWLLGWAGSLTGLPSINLALMPVTHWAASFSPTGISHKFRTVLWIPQMIMRHTEMSQLYTLILTIAFREAAARHPVWSMRKWTSHFRQLSSTKTQHKGLIYVCRRHSLTVKRNNSFMIFLTLFRCFFHSTHSNS